jgi:hypothetical protein
MLHGHLGGLVSFHRLLQQNIMHAFSLKVVRWSHAGYIDQPLV